MTSIHRTKKLPTKKSKSQREKLVVKCSEALKEFATAQSTKIIFHTFGKDKNKKKKSGASTNRGGNSGAARQCSKHLRTLYPQSILQDDEETEFCVNSRNNPNQECKLCSIHETSAGWVSTESFNMAEEISFAIGGTDNPNKKQERYKAAIYHYIVTDYPDINKKYSILRVKKNGMIIIEDFIKISPFSSILKTSSPSGYKYRDRISLGHVIKKRNNKHKDVILCIEEDKTYKIDSETDSNRPFINCSGFWNLLKEKTENERSIRTIIQLNEDRILSVSFKCLINIKSDIKSIDIELVSHKHGARKDPDIISLWHYDKNNTNTQEIHRNYVKDDKYVDCMLQSHGNIGSINIEKDELKDCYGPSFGYNPPQNDNYNNNNNNDNYSTSPNTTSTSSIISHTPDINYLNDDHEEEEDNDLLHHQINHPFNESQYTFDSFNGSNLLNEPPLKKQRFNNSVFR